MFDKQNPKQDFYELEQAILKWWKENEILKKSISQKDDSKQFTFYDGPITANGEPHTGHMLTFSLKDIIPRYKTMKGFKVSRSLGWDCHGLPVEYQVEKALGFKEKSDIEKYGIKEFNKQCKESVEKYRKNIIQLEEMVGRLTNEEEEYATMDKNFIESVWWSLKELYDQGKLYEGFKVVPYSTRAGTTLSNAEVALGGYKPFIDPAITVEFALEEDPSTRILAWTTTPWTIPSNLGLAVGKSIKYSVVQKKSDSKKKFIVATDLIKEVFRDEEITVVKEISASDLVGKKYIPPFDFFKGRSNAHVIYTGSHVNTDSGTGIVHLAPYGAEDNDIFQKVGIESFDVLDEQGDFTNEIEPYAGMFYRKANKYIIKDLENKEVLFRHEDYEHDMPMCWRTDTPLIYKPITSWYIAMSKMRGQLVKNNSKVNWIPKHAKEGRFGNWLAEIKDWGISRKRYWGTPLPIWKSETGKVVVIGSYAEIENLSGVKIDDPHRPFVDDITFEKDGETFTRITDVLDVWYDSGAMPFARFHYPFENTEKFESKFPAQYIAEGIDQTRGWFYSLHAVATSLFNSNAYNNVIINGTITDDKGQKLSKSKGNYTAPEEVINTYGADTVRINFFSSPLMYGEDTAITDKTLRSTKQDFTLPLWNIFSYLITYANIHNWKPREELAYNGRCITTDEHPWDHIPFDDIDNNLDAWVLMKLQNTIKKVNEEMESYSIPKATKEIKEFISELSKWYIRSCRDRFAEGELRAIEVLYYVLVELSKLIAPFAPFISEHIYRTLVTNELQNQVESVHLTDYPIHDEVFITEYSRIIEEMELVRKITELGHNLRVDNQVKVRQPLKTLEVRLTNSKISALSPWMSKLVSNELNIKEVIERLMVSESDEIKSMTDESLGLTIGIDFHIDEGLRNEGIVRDLLRQIQASRKSENFKMGEKVNMQIYTSKENIKEFISQFRQEISDSTGCNIEFSANKIEGQTYEFHLLGGSLEFGFLSRS